MKRSLLKLAIIAIAVAPVWAADDFKLPMNLEKLAEHATESVDVTLDQSTLQLASGFLSKDDPDEAQVKKMIGKLKGIYVRSFEFEKEGQYSMSDVQAMRAQLKGTNWTRIVGVKSIKGENTEVYLLKNGDQIGGIVVLDAEPKELTIVHVDGSISPEELSRLGGHMGIPELGKDKKTKGNGSSAGKDKKDDDEQSEKEQ
jgi:hypothetical protein